MTSRLLDEHEIEPDPRYRICVKEAVIAGSMFVGTAIVTVTVLLFLGLGRDPQDLDWIAGLPSYLFWGVLVTQAGVLTVLAVVLRFVYEDIPLSPDGEPPDETKP